MKALAMGVALVAALAGCASTPTVNTDFDRGASFANYRTYTWIKKPEGTSPLVQQRIVSAIDAQLLSKGWREAGADADVALAGHVATQQQHSLDTFYSGPGWGGYGWGGAWGPGMATTTVRTYTVGTLVVDMFDTKSKQAVWRGTASSTVSSTPSPDKINAQIQAAVTKMFADFPPGSAPAK